MTYPAMARTPVSSRQRRVVAVILSLAIAGTGHFLLGAFRQGVVWVVGWTFLWYLLLYTAVIPLLSLVFVALIAHLAVAIDTSLVVRPRPVWRSVVGGWIALLCCTLTVDLLALEPIATEYAARYAAYRVPTASMSPTFLVGDFIMADKSAYQVRGPERADIVVLRYEQEDGVDYMARIVGMPGERLRLDGQRTFIDGKAIPEPYALTPIRFPVLGLSRAASHTDVSRRLF